MWFSKSVAEVLQEFNVDPDQGLSTVEVEAKYVIYGENILKSKPKKGLVSLFFTQLLFAPWLLVLLFYKKGIYLRYS